MTSSTIEAGTRTCSSTRLALVPSPGHVVHRIGTTSYGPMNPQPRGSEDARHEWSRWDTANGRTLYLGSSAAAAFAESLPYGRENLPEAPLTDYFDDIDEKDSALSFRDAVLEELPGMRESITKGWRDQRTHWEYRLPRAGWFVDIHAADSLSAVNEWAAARTVTPARLTLSDLTSEDRALTTLIAGWVRDQTLDDGSLPLGIRYLSKHGSNLHAYALWLRAVDDGKPVGQELTKVIRDLHIHASDADLRTAAGWHGLRVY